MTGRLVFTAALLLAACSREPAPPAAPPTAAPSPPRTIPAALQGRYGLRSTDCDERAGDMRGLLTIGDAVFAFGATPAKVDRVVLLPDRLIFDVTEQQSGVVASRRYVFNVSADKRQLTRQEAGLPDRVYTRCAIQPS